MEKTFPYLEVKGSYRDIGFAIGETFKTGISSHISKFKKKIPSYEKLRESAYPYFIHTLRWFPQHIDEITGISAGANVDVSDYFFLNVPELYDREDVNTSILPERCTTIVSRNGQTVRIGHNEDWNTDAIDELFILKATIGNTSYLCLDYITYISGSSVSVNSYGLVQCIDSLHSRPAAGIPSYFAARAVLECPSISEAENVLKNHRWASGFNHLLIENDSVVDIEVCAQSMNISQIRDETYTHTNHFLSPELIQFETARSESSLARLKRATVLINPNMSQNELESVLSDTKDKNNPINKPDETIASVIVEPEKLTLWVCYGRPGVGKFLPYSL